MIEYSTVYCRFYRGASLVSGIVLFTPRHRTVTVEGVVYVLSTIEAAIENGILVHNGYEGINLPASPFGITWDVLAIPGGFSNVIQSYPGDIISLGD